MLEERLKETKEAEKINPDLLEDFLLYESISSPELKNIFGSILSVYLKCQGIWLTAIYFILSIPIILLFPIWGLVFDIWRSYKLKKLHDKQK